MPDDKTKIEEHQLSIINTFLESHKILMKLAIRLVDPVFIYDPDKKTFVPKKRGEDNAKKD